MSKPSQYFVVNENTLCYQIDGERMMGVLHGNIFKGGHDALYGPIYVYARDAVRSATLADFVEYRCQAPKDFAQTQRPDSVARRFGD